MAGSNVVELIGPSYHLTDRKAAVQRSVNCFPQKLGGEKWMIAHAPGEVTTANLGSAVRGSIATPSRWFVVAGSTVFEMNFDGTVKASIGDIQTSTGYVGMADNKTQVAIVDGPYLYILNLDTTALTQISLEAFQGSDEVQELDGYFVFVDPNTDQFYLSAIDDGTNLDALDFSSADSSPDNIITHIVSHRQLWLFGSESAEIWIDSGDAAFPFVRYQSYTLDIGVIGKRAIISAADTIFWIGNTKRGTGIVYMASGNQPQRVSTLAVEEALLASTDLSQATMWTYQVEGHEFIGINAPGLETTWVYDAALQQWHERGEWLAGWQPLRSGFVTCVGGKHFAGNDRGDIVRLDDEVNTLSGRPLVRERTWPHLIQPSMEPIVYRSLELAMKSGNTGVVTLEISNDGGFTFGTPLQRPLGVTGRFMQRIRWNRLGAAINRVFRIRCSDPVPFGIHAAALDA